MQGKQAKMVSPIQERAILGSLATTRSPARDQVMFLVSRSSSSEGGGRPAAARHPCATRKLVTLRVRTLVV
jgi:hypothetical protein